MRESVERDKIYNSIFKSIAVNSNEVWKITKKHLEINNKDGIREICCCEFDKVRIRGY